jgi:hypothetical protein
MQGRTPTKAEAAWMSKARQLGCIICIKERKTAPWATPPEYTAIHHIEGKTKPEAHFLTLPLCPAHHQTGPDALHRNKAKFEAKFGTQKDLLIEAAGMVANTRNNE